MNLLEGSQEPLGPLDYTLRITDLVNLTGKHLTHVHS